MVKHQEKINVEETRSNKGFLKDVFFCLLSAFGGPESILAL
jgi:hypothetical protein